MRKIKHPTFAEKVLIHRGERSEAACDYIVCCLLQLGLLIFLSLNENFPFCSSSVSVSDSPINHYTKRVVSFACFWHEHLLSSLDSGEKWVRRNMKKEIHRTIENMSQMTFFATTRNCTCFSACNKLKCCGKFPSFSLTRLSFCRSVSSENK